LSRAVDYLVTVPEIDGKRIALVGHSRNGKTALLAGAMDARVAMVIPSQSGCCGAAPSRVAPELSQPQANGRSIVETVARINTSFPHWFCALYQQFNEEPARLPFDQHELIALCAPRPVLISAAEEDKWANPAGMFEMEKLADPVYRLVAGEGLDAKEMPELLKPVASRLGYFIRPGKHEMNETDWAMWLDYADRWLK
jgi:dienelactone hydrolase